MQNKEIQRIDWWPTPVWNFDILTDEIDPSIIEKECYQKRIMDEGKQASNINGWQSNNIYSYADIPNIGKLIDTINNYSREVFTDYGVRPEFTTTIEGCWININPHNSSNHSHIHVSSYMAGIYYVKVPEDSGELILQNNTLYYYLNSTFLDTNNPITKPCAHYKPAVGRVIIFPSWVPHYVLTNNSHEDRVSIAFNFKLYNS